MQNFKLVLFYGNLRTEYKIQCDSYEDVLFLAKAYMKAYRAKASAYIFVDFGSGGIWRKIKEL